jgi:hypothetical protein
MSKENTSTSSLSYRKVSELLLDSTQQAQTSLSRIREKAGSPCLNVLWNPRLKSRKLLPIHPNLSEEREHQLKDFEELLVDLKTSVTELQKLVKSLNGVEESN